MGYQMELKLVVLAISALVILPLYFENVSAHYVNETNIKTNEDIVEYCGFFYDEFGEQPAQEMDHKQVLGQIGGYYPDSETYEEELIPVPTTSQIESETEESNADEQAFHQMVVIPPAPTEEEVTQGGRGRRKVASDA